MKEIRVTSISGHNTCIEVPHLKVAFDMGICPRSAISMQNIMITHGHMDHIGAIATHAARRNLGGLPPANYFLNPKNIDAVEMVFEGFERLGQEEIPHNLIPISPGDSYQINNGREIRPFHSMHRVQCQGYAIYAKKKKLRDEYANLTGQEIGALAREGVKVNEEVVFPEIAYTGDTLIDVIDYNDVVRTVKHLIIEVTFLDNKVPVKQARKWGHIHLDEIIERADLFENEKITFTHLSARYSVERAKEILEARLPETLKNKVELMV